MEGDRKAWPLQVLFLLALVGGAIGLFEPQLFAVTQAAGTTGTPTAPDRTVAWVLVAIAAASAVALYVPAAMQTFKILDALGSATERRAGTLLARIGQPDNATTGTLLARMKNLDEAFGTAKDREAGTLLARMGNLETLLERLCRACEDRLARGA
jgi:hypothetical protein